MSNKKAPFGRDTLNPNRIIGNKAKAIPTTQNTSKSSTVRSTLIG